MDRIEKSVFRPGEYVGYADGVWQITKSKSSYGNWHARHRDIPNLSLNAFTLRAMNTKLAEYDHRQLLAKLDDCGESTAKDLRDGQECRRLMNA